MQLDSIDYVAVLEIVVYSRIKLFVIPEIIYVSLMNFKEWKNSEGKAINERVSHQQDPRVYYSVEFESTGILISEERHNLNNYIFMQNHLLIQFSSKEFERHTISFPCNPKQPMWNSFICSHKSSSFAKLQIMGKTISSPMNMRTTYLCTYQILKNLKN